MWFYCWSKPKLKGVFNLKLSCTFSFPSLHRQTSLTLSLVLTSPQREKRTRERTLSGSDDLVQPSALRFWELLQCENKPQSQWQGWVSCRHVFEMEGITEHEALHEPTMLGSDEKPKERSSDSRWRDAGGERVRGWVKETYLQDSWLIPCIK